MRGLDTNVLVRYFTEDDPDQAAVARELLLDLESRGQRAHLSVIVLCEMVWVLGGRPYRYDRHSTAAVLERLLETPLFEIEGRNSVRLALRDYRQGSGDFADYLLGWRNRSCGCDDTVTFDRHLDSSRLFATLPIP